MAFSTEGVAPWIIYRILNFLNDAQSTDDIIGAVFDDPSDGVGNTIGRTIAAKILNKKNSLPYRRFTTIEELADIKGLGQDKFQDLVYTFGVSAADAFRSSMYDDGIIFESNWDLFNYTTHFEDKEKFLAIANQEEEFRLFVARTVEKMCLERNEKNIDDCRDYSKNLLESYIDTYFNSTPAAEYAFALWFYLFDADNWFSYDMILEQVGEYFGYYTGYPWEMELKFFKGFDHQKLLPGITPLDLPVVVNYPEQAITVWTSALYD
jgi:hypothetical protein